MKWLATLFFSAYVALPLTWGTVREAPLAAPVISVMVARVVGTRRWRAGGRHASGGAREELAGQETAATARCARFRVGEGESSSETRFGDGLGISRLFKADAGCLGEREDEREGLGGRIVLLKLVTRPQKSGRAGKQSQNVSDNVRRSHAAGGKSVSLAIWGEISRNSRSASQTAASFLPPRQRNQFDESRRVAALSRIRRARWRRDRNVERETKRERSGEAEEVRSAYVDEGGFEIIIIKNHLGRPLSTKKESHWRG